MHDGQNDVSSRFTRAALMSHNKSLSLLVVVLYDGHSIRPHLSKTQAHPTTSTETGGGDVGL